MSRLKTGVSVVAAILTPGITREFGRTGGADDAACPSAHRFLEQEAIPAVAEAYRVNGARVLVGHSMGGLFTLYPLLQTPALFNGYFAFSPSVWIADEQILGELERAAPASSAVPPRLFLSLGETEGNQMLSGCRALETLLASWPTSSLRWQATITGGADHGSNPELSIPVAARWYSER